jgi:hypothetical protein
MGSVEEMFWSCAEDLFRDVDLADLYIRQRTVLGGESLIETAPMVLVHTGKTAIGICLGPSSQDLDDLWQSLRADDPLFRENLLFSSTLGEIFE